MVQPLPWPRWIEILAILVFWTLLGAIALVRRALNPMADFSLHTIAVTAVEYGPWLVITPFVFWLARQFSLERKRWLMRLVLHFAVALTVTAALAGLHQWAIPALGMPRGVTAMPQPPAQHAPGPATRPPQRPPGAASPSSGGPPQAIPTLHLAFYLFVLGIGFARAYAIQMQARQKEAERLEAEAMRLDAERARLAAQLTEAQLGALRRQLNPHLIFNALNAVSALARSDPAGVRKIVARLSKLLRRVLDIEATEEIPLKEEFAFLRDYIDLQRVRFEDELIMEEEIAEETLDALVPNLLLQPLIENAIEHGVSKRVTGGGRIILHSHREQEPNESIRIVVSITDNGPGLHTENNSSPRSKHIGLSNTRLRLQAHYGDAGSLTLKAAPGCGTTVTVTLPYRNTVGSLVETHPDELDA